MTEEREALLKAAVDALTLVRRDPTNGIIEMLRAYQTLEKVARIALGYPEDGR